MGLLDNTTQQQYYSGRKSFTGDGTTTVFQVSQAEFSFPDATSALNTRVRVYINGVLIQGGTTTNPASNQYTFEYDTTDFWHIDFAGGANPYGTPASGDAITFEGDVIPQWNDFGGYQFTSLNSIISQFFIAYVGEGKIISKIKRTDVAFYAQRALAELSFDTFKSTKSQEIEIPASLRMILPQDYVNYIKLTWSDSSGVEHIIYPTKYTSNPFNPRQNADGTFSFDIDNDEVDDTTELIPNENSDTLDSYSEITPTQNQDDYNDNTYGSNEGRRYGLDPQHSQVNGSFYIDSNTGFIHFSSNISGKTVILHYISDSLGTDEEMKVHKFAEEAMYKHIAHAVLSTRVNTPEYMIARFKKEKFAETRKAKLRLSNIKLEEITQILRGRSKQIKH